MGSQITQVFTVVLVLHVVHTFLKIQKTDPTILPIFHLQSLQTKIAHKKLQLDIPLSDGVVIV